MPAVPPAALPELTERLTRAAGRREAHEAAVAGCGAFPRPARARVLWAGVSTQEETLRHLAGAARAAARRTGVEVSSGPFRAHVTLGRTGRPTDMTGWVGHLREYAGPPWTVSEVHLVASHLGRGAGGRAVHETVATFALGARTGPKDPGATGDEPVARTP